GPDPARSRQGRVTVSAPGACPAGHQAGPRNSRGACSRCRRDAIVAQVLDGAQDSDGGELQRYWGRRWGMTGEAAGGVFVVGGTWPMGVGWVRCPEVTMR
ncbi:MAG TPA: hypothetical protein VGY50_13520, partial [Streptosporangiaceae bacterium]|nr:hypothetical protein [Streptosporangiaceae bacterium]